MKLRKIAERVLDILSIRTTTKLWSVEVDNWNDGYRETFWLKKRALKYVAENMNAGLWISVKNELRGDKIKIKSNPDKIEAPIADLPF